MTRIQIDSRLATFAASLNLTVDLLDDGHGGFVTRGHGDAGGILLGTTERAARTSLRRLATN